MRNFITAAAISILFILLYNNTVYADSSKIINAQELYEAADLHAQIQKCLESLNRKYPDFTELTAIGSSVEGRSITAFKIGKGEKEIFINGSHHAREFITSILLMDQIEELADAYNAGGMLGSLNVRSVLDAVSIWFVPLVNPDGVQLCKTGIIPSYFAALPAFQGAIFPSWKANINGVDLNRNYDALWSSINDAVENPSGDRYPGPEPFSEPETAALRDFCRNHSFELAAAYHCSGELIYWYFNQRTEQDEQRDLNIGLSISNLTGYTLCPKENITVSGGFKDWFIAELEKPGYTIEVGKGISTEPLSFYEYPAILEANRLVPISLAQSANEMPFGGSTITDAADTIDNGLTEPELPLDTNITDNELSEPVLPLDTNTTDNELSEPVLPLDTNTVPAGSSSLPQSESSIHESTSNSAAGATANMQKISGNNKASGVNSAEALKNYMIHFWSIPIIFAALIPMLQSRKATYKK